MHQEQSADGFWLAGRNAIITAVRVDTGLKNGKESNLKTNCDAEKTKSRAGTGENYKRKLSGRKSEYQGRWLSFSSCDGLFLSVYPKQLTDFMLSFSVVGDRQERILEKKKLHIKRTNRRCFVCSSLFLTVRLPRSSGWNLKSSDTLTDPLEP